MSTIFTRRMAHSVRFGLFVAFFVASSSVSEVEAQEDWEAGEPPAEEQQPEPQGEPAQTSGSQGGGGRSSGGGGGGGRSSGGGGGRSSGGGGGGDAAFDTAEIGQPTSENPHGMWVAAGLEAMARGSYSGAWLRLEGGIPLGVGPAPGLSIMLPLSFTVHDNIYDAPGLGRVGYKYSAFAVTPGVRYEYPIYDGYGALSAFGELGGGILLEHIEDVDLVYEDTYVLGALRFGVGATYVFPFGLFFVLQPAGVFAYFGNDRFDNSISGAAYDFDFLVGFRLQGN